MTSWSLLVGDHWQMFYDPDQRWRIGRRIVLYRGGDAHFKWQMTVWNLAIRRFIRPHRDGSRALLRWSVRIGRFLCSGRVI